MNLNIIDMSQFVEIPLKIDKSVFKPSYSKIPRRIIQIYKTNKIHTHIYKNVMKMIEKNPEYDYLFITYEIARELIKKHFDEKTMAAYEKIQIGAAKADFIRYVVLYLYGGIYLDLDASIEIEIDRFIPNDTDFIFFYRFVDETKMTQWIFFTKPENHIIKKIINEMVDRIHNNETNIFIATGPTLFTDVIYNLINNTNIYNIIEKTTIDERKHFLSNISNKMTLNGLFYDMCEYENILKFRMDGYETSMLYFEEERFKPDSNIFEPTKKITNQPAADFYSKPSSDCDLKYNFKNIYKDTKIIFTNLCEQEILFEKYKKIVNILLEKCDIEFAEKIEKDIKQLNNLSKKALIKTNENVYDLLDYTYHNCIMKIDK